MLLVNHSDTVNKPTPSVGTYYKLEGGEIHILFFRKPNQLICDLIKSKGTWPKTEALFRQREFYYTSRKRFWHAPISVVSLAIAMIKCQTFQ